VWLRWVSIVFGLTNSCAAASRLVAPSATRSATCSSCGVKRSRVSAIRRRARSPVAASSRRVRSAQGAARRPRMSRAPSEAGPGRHSSCGPGAAHLRNTAPSGRDRTASASVRDARGRGRTAVPPRRRPLRASAMAAGHSRRAVLPGPPGFHRSARLERGRRRGFAGGFGRAAMPYVCAVSSRRSIRSMRAAASGATRPRAERAAIANSRATASSGLVAALAACQALRARKASTSPPSG
jgi:hypothetical protein